MVHWSIWVIFWVIFALIATATWKPEIKKKFVIESYRANENLHWNLVERHPVADTTHAIHHSNRLDEPNMFDTWVIWPLLVKKFDQAVKYT